MAILKDVYLPGFDKYSKQAGSLLSPSDVQFIFRGLDEIQQVSSQFTESVRVSIEEKDALDLGDTFRLFAHSFKLFDPFICKFDQATDMIRKAQRKSERFRSFLDEIQMSDGAKGQDIASLMIRPVQLLPRFSLLLRDLMKYTDPESPGYPALEKGAEVIDSVATQVNTRIADYQNRQQMLKLCESIRGCPEEVLQPHRSVVRTGMLDKVCRNSVESRFFVLFSDSLLYASTNTHNSNISSPTTAAAAQEALTQAYQFHRQIPLENSRTLPIQEFQANTLRLIRRFGTGIGTLVTSSTGQQVTNDLPDSTTDSSEPEHTQGPPSESSTSGVQRTIDAINQIADPTHCFLLVTPDKSFILKAPSPSESTAWQGAINQVCANVRALASENPMALEDVRQGKARRRRLLPFLGLRPSAQAEQNGAPHRPYMAPVWVPDILAPNCMSCGVEFTQLRRRHHCRFCGAAVCGTCSAHTFPLVAGEKPKRVCEMCHHELLGSPDLPPQLTEETLIDLSDTVLGPALAYPDGWFAQQCPLRPGLLMHRVAQEWLHQQQFAISQDISNARADIEEMNANYVIRCRTAQQRLMDNGIPVAEPLNIRQQFWREIQIRRLSSAQSGSQTQTILVNFFTPDDKPPHFPLEGALPQALIQLPKQQAVEEMKRAALGFTNPWDVHAEYEFYRRQIADMAALPPGGDTPPRSR